MRGPRPDNARRTPRALPLAAPLAAQQAEWTSSSGTPRMGPRPICTIAATVAKAHIAGDVPALSSRTFGLRQPNEPCV